jgi:murein DD-endopeptidase MepM/ murein hydrolase activator NlpD
MKISFVSIFSLTLLLLTSCLQTPDTYLSQSKRIAYIKRLEDKINEKTNSDYGHIILQYDLLSLASDDYFCSDSSLYNSLLEEHSTSKRAFRKKIHLLIRQINKKARSAPLLDLANKKIALQINHFNNLAKKLPLPQTAKNKFLQQKNPNIFGIIDESFAQEARLSFIKEYISPSPLLFPMKNAHITSLFGKRKSPIHPRKVRLEMHYGIDAVSRRNYQIYATAPGVVKFAGAQVGFGNVVIIDHGYGYQTYYAHLDSFVVKEKEPVLSGQVIGIQGSSGKTTNFHLHYEIRYHNKPLDPMIFFKANSNCCKF